ncbi:MAG: twin-arginine translocase subunit TatC [Acidobacteria bacterium]|nr:twin-arginine translocase subunit TatC [Acidobacteriota bacterium]
MDEERWHEEEDASSKMSFLEHLDELRRRILNSLIAVALAFGVCWFFRVKIFHFLAAPVVPFLEGGTLVFTRLTEPFTLYMKVSMLAGLFLAAPYVLYQVWLFMSPGLYRREKAYAIPFLVSSVTLFLSGGAFAYFVLLPKVYPFLIEFGRDFKPLLTIDQYFSLTASILLGVAVTFEIPVVVAFLSMFGMVTPRFLWRNFKYAILLVFITAAVISPTPDVINQCLYAAPMLLLYVVSIGISWIFKRRREAAHQPASETL